ncbi:MAG: UvrD-helicase domain-containing protein [Limnochordales bacterium]|nr:UvrD-helicase domain-containing protein [Limnochordales bacterium]
MNRPSNLPQWTEAQRLAIQSRPGSLLVAASAGAGKTAVLTERIVNLLRDKSRPVSLDRLLVVTFTRAAADEMRQRIGRRLQELLQQYPEDRQLRLQMLLLDQAHITTIDAFCLWLVQHGFYLVGLDPDFRVADPDEMRLIEDEVLDGVFSAAYQKAEDGDSALGELLRSYGDEREARYLRQLVLRLYKYAFSLPEPWAWLDSLTNGYTWSRAATEAMRETPGWADAWRRELVDMIDEVLAETVAVIDEALRLTALPGGPVQYATTFTTAQSRLESVRTQLRNCQDWDQLHALLSGLLPLPYLPRSGKTGSPGDDSLLLRTQAKKLYGRARDKLKKLELVHSFTSQQIENELRRHAVLVGALLWLVREFAAGLASRKRELNLVDFNDIEHRALELLRRRGETKSLISLAYDEILVDEYQDINPLQEAILLALAQLGKSGDPEAPGTRFLVGDVKQSIYRFRLAEPAIFLEKQQRFLPLSVGGDGASSPVAAEGDGRAEGEVGFCLTLRENFRSRPPIIHGVNTLFRQIWRREVGELDYNEEAELVPGYEYPPYPEADAAGGTVWPIEVHLIESARDAALNEVLEGSSLRSDADEPEDRDGGDAEYEPEYESESKTGRDSLAEELAEEETAAREAALIADIIQELVRPSGGRPMLVWDRAEQCYRPIRYSDIAVLHRAANQVSSVLLEILEAAGVPVFSEVGTGFLRTVEIETMRALLRVLDNPRRDIPLAALLRSPLIGLDAEQLAQIRIASPDGSFWDACRVAAEKMPEVGRAVEMIEAWRTAARREPLSRLIWQVYRETGFYYYVAGLPGGDRRQANLRAFYDRACQFDSFARQGLNRFVRFLDHLEAEGVESPEAPMLGEGDNVVRILSIHRSKGLEMPVVIVAGLGRSFNLNELKQDILFHRHLGVAMRTVDHERAIRYATPVYQAVRQARRKELLAEELRVLYVALTRARERLILVGSLSQLQEKLVRWASVLDSESEKLPSYLLAGAQNYLDWLGPALIRHPDASLLRRLASPPDAPSQFEDKPGVRAIARAELARQAHSCWRFHVHAALELDQAVNVLRRGARLQPEAGHQLGTAEDGTSSVMAQDEMGLAAREIEALFNWEYPHLSATRTVAKLSVSEWKRSVEAAGLGTTGAGGGPEADEEAGQLFPRREWWRSRTGQEKVLPGFLRQGDGLTAAEKGTATHLLLQHLDLSRGYVDEGVVRETLAALVARELLSPRAAAAVSVDDVIWFFGTELGRLLLETGRAAPGRVRREVRFTWTWPVQGERILVQGTIDGLVEQDDGTLVLIEFKTDSDRRPLSDLVQRYRVQVELYREAVSSILHRPVSRLFLVFLALRQVVEVGEQEAHTDPRKLPPLAVWGG